MKCEDLFSLKKKKKMECHLLQILLGALRKYIRILRVNMNAWNQHKPRSDGAEGDAGLCLC